MWIILKIAPSMNYALGNSRFWDLAGSCGGEIRILPTRKILKALAIGRRGRQGDMEKCFSVK